MSYRSVPLKGGPFDGQRRPIVDGVVPELVERLVEKGGPIQVYKRMTDNHGHDCFLYAGERKIGHKLLVET